MNSIFESLEEELRGAFAACGYDTAGLRVVRSNRPDLCEFQCNYCMQLAKAAHKAPLAIAEEVVEHLTNSRVLAEAGAAAPGFLNFNLHPAFLAERVCRMEKAPDFGFEKVKNPRVMIIDYGGPNVAKPLHVGHLRSAIIGESIKRICRFAGDTVMPPHTVTAERESGARPEQCPLL